MHSCLCALTDLDSSGFISAEEVTAFVKLVKYLMELAGYSAQYTGSTAPNHILIAREVVSCLFRVFDADKSGNIDTPELVLIFSSWLITLLNLGTDIVIILETFLESDHIKKFADEAGSVAASKNTVVTVEEATENFLKIVPKALLSHQPMTEMDSTLNDLPASRLTLAREVFEEASTKLAELFQSLPSKSKSGHLMEQCIKDAADVLFETLQRLLAPRLLAQAVDVAASWLDSQFRNFRHKSTCAIPRVLIETFFQQLANSLQNFDRAMLCHIVKTFFNFVDVNGDGVISDSELFIFTNNIRSLANVCPALPKLSCPDLNVFL